MQIRVPIAKIESPAGEPFSVSGWALFSKDADGALIWDHEEDAIDTAEMERAVREFVKSAAPVANVLHEGPPVGRLVESVVFTAEKRKAMGIPEGPDGWWLTMEIHDPEAIARVRSGELAELSIQGAGERVPA